MKQKISLLLALVMVIGLIAFLPVSAQAATTGGNLSNGLTWTLEDGVLTISGTGDLVKPVPWNAYTAITSVVIENGITSIAKETFWGVNAVSVSIPDSVTSIGSNAFYNCRNLRSVKLPNGITTLPYRLFRDCRALTDVTIPDSVTHIDDQAFAVCWSLTSITIPKNVVSIGDYAFYLCEKLQEVVFRGDAPTFKSNTFYGSEKVVAYYPEGNETWTKSVMKNYGGNVTWVSYELPNCDEGHTYVNGTCTVCGDTPASVVITKQPASVFAQSGEEVRVSVQAQGDGLTYQWYIKSVGQTEFVQSAVMGNAYSFAMNEEMDGLQIYCVIRDAYGNEVKTQTVTLHMEVAEQTGVITIVSQPTPDDAALGEKATLTVVAKGDDLKYQWYFKDAGAKDFQRSSIKTSTYTLTVKDSNYNRVVYCVITDAHGNEVTTETVHLIHVEETAIIKQPTNASAYLGDKAVVYVEATGYPLTYTWYFRDVDMKNFQRSSITASTYTLTMTEARNGREVYCVITDAYGNKLTTETVKLTLAVKEALEIVSQPVSDNAALGEKAKLTVVARGDALKYQWYFKDAGKDVFTKSSITSSTYVLTVNDSNYNRVVYCVITDAHGNEVTTETVHLIHVEETAIIKQPTNASAYLGDKAVVYVEATGYPLTYTWYFRDVDMKNFQRSSITASTYTLTMTEARNGREVYCVITDAYGNKLTTETVKLTLAVREALEIVSQPESDDAALGEKAKLSVVANGDALTYQWYFKDDGNNTFTKSSITSSTYVLTVNDSNYNRVVYCVITDAHGNQVTTETVHLICG